MCLINHAVSLSLYYYRSTEIKVYSSDINTDVYCSDQNGVNDFESNSSFVIS